MKVSCVSLVTVNAIRNCHFYGFDSSSVILNQIYQALYVPIYKLHNI